IRQMLIESWLLTFAGAAAGVLIAWGAGQWLVALLSEGPIDLVVDLSPNWHVLLFSAALALVVGSVFGLAPAWQTLRGQAAPSLRDDTRTSTQRSRALPVLV